MSKLHRISIGVLVIAGIFAACKDREAVAPVSGTTRGSGISAPTDAQHTMGTGSVSTLLGRATFADPDNQTFNIKRKADDWDIQIKSKPAFDIAVQSIEFQPAGQSGWHSHPGPAIVLVKSGILTLYDGDDRACVGHSYSAGQAFVDPGQGHVHLAGNHSETEKTEVWVTYLDVPPGASPRIDQPNPQNCPF